MYKLTDVMHFAAVQLQTTFFHVKKAKAHRCVIFDQKRLIMT